MLQLYNAEITLHYITIFLNSTTKPEIINVSPLLTAIQPCVHFSLMASIPHLAAHSSIVLLSHLL